MKKSLDWSLFEEYVGRLNDLWEAEAWQKANHHDHTPTKKKGIAEVYTPSPAKPFRNPPGFNKQGTGVGNKLAQLNRKEWEEKKKKEQGVAEDWNKVNHHDKTNGLSQKAVNAYRHEHPGSHLQTAVTTKPSKLKAGSKDANRRKSFCARMSGNKGPMKDEKGRPTPKAKALSRWNCE